MLLEKLNSINEDDNAFLTLAAIHRDYNEIKESYDTLKTIAYDYRDLTYAKCSWLTDIIWDENYREIGKVMEDDIQEMYDDFTYQAGKLLEKIDKAERNMQVESSDYNTAEDIVGEVIGMWDDINSGELKDYIKITDIPLY